MHKAVTMLPKLGGNMLRRSRLLNSSPASSFLPNIRHETTSATKQAPPLRRRRKSSRWDDDSTQPGATIGLAEPFSSSESTADQYLQKASLSPWVPAPDPVARKMLEVAKADSTDVHVDLGSGDGRLNFHAIDPPFSVKQSIGIDIDENLVEMAKDRLSKRHPVPNVEFIQSDLLENEDIYSHVQKATVVTMYFVKDALKRIQPHLVQTFKGRDVRIVTCGYSMPDWEPQWVEVILGLPVFLYELRANEEIPLASPQKDASSEDEEDLLNPIGQDENDDVERIEIPLYDPEEKVDFHWDSFDQVDDSDSDEAPPIWWRNPK